MNNMHGRSMIEMLGTLAIIGVLSVGGLAGYSKAMNAYRVNQTVNDITHIVTNVHNLFCRQPDYGDLSSSNVNMSSASYANRIIADAAKLFPDSIVKNGYKNAFNGDIRFYRSGGYASGDNKAFILRFANIPQDACINLVTKNWNDAQGLIAVKVNNNGVLESITKVYEKSCSTQFTNGNGLICAQDVPLTPSQAAQICNTEIGQVIAFKFY